MPYTATTWVDNVTLGNQTRMNNLESQYTEATNSFEQDLWTAFVLSGLVATKDGTTVNQLDVTAGVAFLQQSDGTLRRRAPAASTTGQFTTSTINTTYYLFLNNDGTWTWGTASTGPANSLAIAQATTDASGNISAVTDKRTLNTTLLAAALGRLFVPQFGVTGTSSLDNGNIVTDGLGTISGKHGPATPTAPTLALVAGTALGIGAYGYRVTYTSSLGESVLGTVGTVTTTSGNQAVNLSAIPTGPAGTTGRKIYRTKVGGSTYFLLATLSNNTATTYSDTTADTSLTVAAPAHPSMGGDSWQNSAGTTTAQIYSDGALWFDTGKVTSDGSGNLFAVGFQTNRNGVLTPVASYTGTATPAGDGVTTPQTGAIWVKA